MANQNAFLAVRMDADTLQALERVGRALEEAPANLLGMPEGIGFEYQENLHMTFLFFGEHLRNLQADELRKVHTIICEQISAALAQVGAPTTPLQFIGFELFPPQKMNLVVARFAATEPLLLLRTGILEACKNQGVNFPKSYFSLIAGEGAWSPHVTLGKIRASKAQIGSASCSNPDLVALTPSFPVRPRGLLLLGETPRRAWCDWEVPLAFVEEAEDELEAQPQQNATDAQLAPFEQDRLDLLAWLHDELKSKLEASASDALHASAEALIFGIDPGVAGDHDAAEASENVALILIGESDELGCIGQEFKQRFMAIWERHSAMS